MRLSCSPRGLLIKAACLGYTTCRSQETRLRALTDMDIVGRHLCVTASIGTATNHDQVVFYP
ncbi:MAG: hypothetical protein ACKVU2_10465 [Saprospiraceae bacterium]